MSYRTTERADLDIAEIYRHGAVAFGLVQAERDQDELFRTFSRLAENPRIARERIEITPPVRLHPYGAHLIIFVQHGDGIVIVCVLHGRQDWERLLS